MTAAGSHITIIRDGGPRRARWSWACVCGMFDSDYRLRGAAADAARYHRDYHTGRTR